MGKINEKFGRNGELVMVCDNCKRASCWQGVFACDKFHTAGTIKLPIEELKKMKLENPRFWYGDE